MIENTNNNFAENKNGLYEVFNKKNKSELIDSLCASFVSENHGDTFGYLCKELQTLFDDKTKGEEYFNNLINILEILDWGTKQFYGDCFSMLYQKLRDDKVNCFIDLVKKFGIKESEYMFVVKNANGDKFETPGLTIATVRSFSYDSELIIASDIDNTCKTGLTLKQQFENRLQDLSYKGDVYGFLSDLKRKKDYYEWATKIRKVYGLDLNQLNSFIKQIQKYNIYNFARLLSKPENNKILFYNIPIRGKGNGDFSGIDSEEFELFSMFDKNFMFKLPRYHLSVDDQEISDGDMYGANFLLDQMSFCNNDLNSEGYEAANSELTGLGKNVTKTGLKWFLDETEYKVIENEYSGVITVKKNTDDMIIGNDKCLSQIQKISDETIFDQISKVEQKIDEEINGYTNKLINDVNFMLNLYFQQVNLMSDFNNGEKSSVANIQEAKLNRMIQSDIEQFISLLCEFYESVYADLNTNEIKMSDECNFAYLLKKVIRPVIGCCFKHLSDDEKNSLTNKEKSVAEIIKNKFDENKLFDNNTVKEKLIEEIYYNKGSWTNPKKYDKIKNDFVDDDFKFDFDKANLNAYKTATLLNRSFDEFKTNMKRIYGDNLPSSKNDFEQKFEQVDCNKFIDFLKKEMQIDVDKEFLKKALSAKLYTWVESIHGNDDNGDSTTIAERLQEMRKSFFVDYLGTKFIHEVKLYASEMVARGEKPLPDAFYQYNSDDMLNGKTKTKAFRFTVVNYVQAIYHAVPVLKRKKFGNLSWWSRWWSHRNFNKNIEETRRILQTGTEAERNQVFERIRKIKNRQYQDNIWGLPLAFLDILLDGVNIDLGLQEKIDICTFARNYVNYDLDDVTKKHVTKSNFVEIDKKDNCYLKSNGQLVLPLANLFAPGAIDELLSKMAEEDRLWNHSFCCKLGNALADVWHYFDESNILIKLLAKALFVCLFTPLFPIIGLVFSIAYIVYKKDLQNSINELSRREDFRDIFNMLKTAEAQGRKEYNRLQNFRQEMKKAKPLKSITGNKTIYSGNLNQKSNIIDDLKINQKNKTNHGDIFEVDTDSNQINSGKL